MTLGLPHMVQVLLHEKPTLLIGIDVYHPGPASDDPSWGSVVYSTDRDATRWRTATARHLCREEKVEASRPWRALSHLVSLQSA